MAHAAVSLGLAAVVAQGLIAPPAQSDGRRHAQASPPPSPSVVQGPQQGRQMFDGLFALPEDQRAASAPSSGVAQVAEMLKRHKREMRDPASGPTVVCGMVVVPMAGDPDPGMPRATPPASIHFTIRAVPPPICRD
jgi:hypothetical protein